MDSRGPGTGSAQQTGSLREPASGAPLSPPLSLSWSSVKCLTLQPTPSPGAHTSFLCPDRFIVLTDCYQQKVLAGLAWASSLESGTRDTPLPGGWREGKACLVVGGAG